MPEFIEGEEFDPKRAARAAAMLHSNERYRSNIDNVGDVLLDVMHYCVQNGIDFGTEAGWAKNAFKEDQEALRQDGEAVP